MFKDTSKILRNQQILQESILSLILIFLYIDDLLIEMKKKKNLTLAFSNNTVCLAENLK